MKQLKTIITIGVLIACVACKKENKENRMDLLTSGSWKMIAFTIDPGYDYDGDGDIDTDLFAVTEACVKDDIFSFKRNGAFEVDQGLTKCDANDPQLYTTDWEFTNNERSIVISGEEYDIEELSSTRLKISQHYAGEQSVITLSK